jgi:hypothetical protein
MNVGSDAVMAQIVLRILAWVNPTEHEQGRYQSHGHPQASSCRNATVTNKRQGIMMISHRMTWALLLLAMGSSVHRVS